MKILSWKKKGNVVRFYLGEDDLEDWYGDDWSDRSYESNAGMIPYDDFGFEYVDIAFYYNIDVFEAADDWHYHGNSPFCMNDFKERKAPILVLYKRKDEYDWGNDYSQLIGGENSNNFHKIYMGDSLESVSMLTNFGKVLEKGNGWEV